MKQLFIGVLFVNIFTSFNPKFEDAKVSQPLSFDLKNKREATKEMVLINAIIQVESSGNPKAHNLKEDARGVLQIRAVMVREINRLSGRSYTHNDAWDKDKSIEMFKTLQKYYNPEWNFKKASKQWNGGYNGEQYKSTERYWQEVKKAIIEAKNLNRNYIMMEQDPKYFEIAKVRVGE